MTRFSLEGKRYDTDKMIDLDISTRERGGVNIVGVYMMPKSKRVFVRTHSIWDRGDGQIVGQRFHEAGMEEIGALAMQHNSDELMDLLPDGDEED